MLHTDILRHITYLTKQLIHAIALHIYTINTYGHIQYTQYIIHVTFINIFSINMKVIMTILSLIITN